MVSGRTARDGGRPGVPDGVRARRVALGVRLRAQRDHVGELGHGVEVADRREPLETERVEPIAGQQREVGIVGLDDAPGGVVLQVALADRLDEQRVALAAAGDGLAVRLRLAPSLARRSSASRPPSARAAPSREPLARRRVMSDLGERRGGRLDGAGDVLGGVRGGREPGLELRRRAGRRRGPAARGTRRRRPRCRRPRRPRSPSAARRRRRRSRRPVVDVTETGRSPAASRRPVGQRAGRVAERQVGLLVEQRERGAAGGDRERVPAQRARLVDVAGRARSAPSAPPSRRTPRRAARRRGSCPSPSGRAARR